MSGDASEASRNCASHYEARQQFLRDSEDEFHRRQKDWQRINQLERALDASTARVDELCKENERLRGLVRDMMRFFEDGDYCTVCEVERECTANEQYNDDCLMRDIFHDRMRELGIEVDGA